MDVIRAIETALTHQKLHDAADAIWMWRHMPEVKTLAVPMFRKASSRFRNDKVLLAANMDTTPIPLLRRLWREIRPCEMILAASAPVDIKWHVYIGNPLQVLATAAFRCCLVGNKCLLVDQSKEIWQSLYPGVSVLQDGEYRNGVWLTAMHKISFRQVVDWLCMNHEMAGVWLEAYGSYARAREHVSLPPMKEYWERRKDLLLSPTRRIFWPGNQ